jgi:hypothetical protein
MAQGRSMKPKTKKQNLPKKVKSKPKTKTAAELTAAFLKTPAMAEHTKIIGTVNAQLDPKDTETICLKIPKQFLTMLEFVERNNAADMGRVANPATKVLGQMVLNELHDMLHWLVVAPAHFDRYRDLWNRFCDQQGAPDQKILAAQTSAEKGGEGPF